MGSIMTSSYTYIMVWITFGPSPCLVPFPLPLIPSSSQLFPVAHTYSPPSAFMCVGRNPQKPSVFHSPGLLTAA